MSSRLLTITLIITMIYYILDNTAFSSGLNINITAEDSELEFITTPEIIEEAKKNRNSSQILSVAFLQERIHVQSPTLSSIEFIKEQAKLSGDIGALSDPDISILSLAYDIINFTPNASVTLLSDDYSIQNTASFIGITFQPLHQMGIKEKIVWEVYCPNCFRKFPPDKLKSFCPVCGGKLKRRRKRKGKRK
ncbi:NOB1 family endonuclease [Candidatus Harpocratesius sp.]